VGHCKCMSPPVKSTVSVYVYTVYTDTNVNVNVHMYSTMSYIVYYC
jgi:hypothetical protein